MDNCNVVTVSADGEGDFKSIQECINAIPADNADRVIIYVKNGIYKEKLVIDKPFITIIGEDPEKTILTYDDCASKLMPNGEQMGTFRSYSTLIIGDYFRAENITFENTAGHRGRVGQALAAYVDADKACFKNCRFLGYQDTLFTGPLPPDAVDVDKIGKVKVIGTAKKNNWQYYENCYIEGDVDFIFGSATAVFYRCEIFSKNRNKNINGYITAASTPESEKYGYVFIDCRLTGDATPSSVYLGRPWRKYAKVAFINCWMGDHIIGEGWNNWRDPEREKTVTYVEYNSKGPGARMDERVKWSRILGDEEAKMYTVENIFAGDTEWFE